MNKIYFKGLPSKTAPINENDKLLRELTGDRYESIKALLPDCWPEMDIDSLQVVVASTISMLK